MWNRAIEFVDDTFSVKEIVRILQCELSQSEIELFADELLNGLKFDEFDLEE